MILLRANFLLLVCIFYVAYVEGARKGASRAKETTGAEKTGNTEGTQKEDRVGDTLKFLKKGGYVLGDTMKGTWNRNIAQYKLSSGGREISVSDKGEDVLIGDKDLPKTTKGDRKMSKADCVEVLSKESHQELLLKIKTKILNDAKEDKSSDFELEEEKLYQCKDSKPNEFFVVEREYKGKIEIHKATVYHNVKAWAVQLTSLWKEGTIIFSKTVRFIERKIFDKDGNPIDYQGEIKLRGPDPKKEEKGKSGGKGTSGKKSGHKKAGNK